MSGLTDSTFLPYLKSGRVLLYLQLHRIRYFVLPELEGQDMHLFYAAEPQAQSVTEFCATMQLFENGYAYTSHAWRCQHLYKLAP
jgi:hypothetical protein